MCFLHIRSHVLSLARYKWGTSDIQTSVCCTDIVNMELLITATYVGIFTMQMVVVEPLMSDKLQVVGDVWRLCAYLDTLLLQLGWRERKNRDS